MASRSSAHTLARGLGWFSIGLGLVEVLAPRKVARGLGLGGQENLIQAYGVREIVTGIGLLAAKDPAPFVWGRVAGDALDLATLAVALDRRNPRQRNAGLAVAALAGITAVDAICAQALHVESRAPKRPLPDYSHRSGFPRPAEEMHGAARDLELPRDYREPPAMRPQSHRAGL